MSRSIAISSTRSRRDRAAGLIRDDEAGAAQGRDVAPAARRRGCGRAGGAAGQRRLRPCGGGARSRSPRSWCCRWPRSHSISHSARRSCRISRSRRGSPGARTNQSLDSLDCTGRDVSRTQSGRWPRLGGARAGLSAIGRVEEAVRARRNALRLNGETRRTHDRISARRWCGGERDGDRGSEGRVRAGGHARPHDVKARYFLGLAAEQDGERAQPPRSGARMLADAPADAPWTAFVRQRARARRGYRRRRRLRQGASSGPSEEQIAAASELGAEQRNVMIRGMVERLPNGCIATARTSRDGCGWCAPIWCLASRQGPLRRRRGAARARRRTRQGSPRRRTRQRPRY